MKVQKIGIIGGGFAGTMTAVQLIHQSRIPCEIIIINEKETFNKGIAYNTYSQRHILNVVTAKMSAYPDKPDHFLEWVMGKKEFRKHDKTLIANSFLPRKLYGEYLSTIWNDSVSIAESKSISIKVIDGFVTDLDLSENGINLWLRNDTKIEIDKCIIATGNHIPRNPKIKNSEFYANKNYFQNPWDIESVKDMKGNLPILIVGNGLTMVDTVLGLLEQGFKGGIFSISPNGFNILPHRHNGLKYSKLTDELTENLSLYDLVKLVNKHRKILRKLGISAEPIIDSLRPHTQRIWKNLSENEKNIFMSRLRHLWGVARHRIPLHTHDKLQQLRIEGKLHIKSGRIIDFKDSDEYIMVEYHDKKEGRVNQINVSRIINCTGPETDLMSLEKKFLKNCIVKGIIKQDNLNLGIITNTETFEVINRTGKSQTNLFTLGSNLKGELWESTAVNELRDQAEKLAEKILAH